MSSTMAISSNTYPEQSFESYLLLQGPRMLAAAVKIPTPINDVSVRK
jgi:hypothetical protein